MEELEQQPRKELRFLWELREFKILFKRSTAAALPVTWLSQNKPHQINHRAERFQNMRWQRTCISLPGAIANRDRFFVSQKFWNSGQTGYIMSFLVLYQFFYHCLRYCQFHSFRWNIKILSLYKRFQGNPLGKWP